MEINALIKLSFTLPLCMSFKYFFVKAQINIKAEIYTPQYFFPHLLNIKFIKNNLGIKYYRR